MGKKLWTAVIIIFLILVTIGYVMLMKNDWNGNKTNNNQNNQSPNLNSTIVNNSSGDSALEALASDSSENLDDSQDLSFESNLESP